ncbi:MAG: fatty acyl-AMP ligase [Aestuariivirga sp.]|uniref:fatty acyl-AMP ligase n=1 Tax=Aestuariivirga sp. TaxID=2650926 RepID=UPI0025C2CCFC|nr:fatty acyl-AMP ligase [Aestuariivirga sp.]MCA3559851.1 fatty acyl-AMP ligase [Aestuariivirga sp.]
MQSALKRSTEAGTAGSVTPTSNRSLAQNLGGFGTLAEGLDYAAKGVTGFNFYSPRGQLQSVLSYAELRRQSMSTARKLLSLGLKRGDRVAVVAETGPEFMAVFFGCQYAGLIACPMPYTMYIGGKDSYIGRVAGMIAAAKAQTVVTGEDLLGHISEGAARAGAGRVLTHAELQALPEAAAKLEPFRANEDAYIQYSSGSTSSPKGVLISQKAIMSNTRGILRDGMRITPEDRAFSWLPLYHDMGLVGLCLSAAMGQVSVDFLATASFARRPALWLKLMSDNKSTITYSPSFGYDLAARRINGEAVTLDLSRLRIAGIGGDMVRADVLEGFAAHLSVAGFRSDAFLPSYGMAETTLAISFIDPDKPIRVDTIDRHALKHEGRAVPARGSHARSFVVCGRPMEGSTVEIRDEHGAVLGPRAVGRIFVNTPSLMTGYYNNDEATAAVVGQDGFLDTGDMGYWLDGEIVITGRAKDLILHNGRNIWPQDIEWAAEQIEPLRDGDVAAFAVENDAGEDEVTVLVQCRARDLATVEALRHEVSAAVHRSAGVECRVVMVPPKSLPFTSSGKLSRAAAKQKFLSGEIAELSLLTLAAGSDSLEAVH